MILLFRRPVLLLAKVPIAKVPVRVTVARKMSLISSLELVLRTSVAPIGIVSLFFSRKPLAAYSTLPA